MFKSFFLGGFECSTHCLRNGKRLDLVKATAHDEFAMTDYLRLNAYGIRCVREGIRWHLIEKKPGHYDFSSVAPILKAARATGTQVVWDLCHFGWPDGLDVFRPEFVSRFARLASTFTKLLNHVFDDPPYICPINEISFLSWKGAEIAEINPFAEERGFEMKCQLVRAAIAAIEAIWEVDERARIFHNEPVFNVIPHHTRPEDADAAEAYRQLQFQAWDMLSGRVWPQLGGKEEYLDIVGVNYYPWNQWYYNGPKHGGGTIDSSVPGYRPFYSILEEVYQRYQRSVFIAETGREGEQRPSWLRSIGTDIAIALQNKLPITGICLYPIVNFPGWENDRHCHNGLWDYADSRGHREIYQPLAEELLMQQLQLSRLISNLYKVASSKNSQADARTIG